ncbi:MAG TPA: hypothetical protein PKD18_09420 [Saprospiraceae bacterium]|nr:hypothetical protein [Saprospiraceae bacterium]
MNTCRIKVTSDMKIMHPLSAGRVTNSFYRIMDSMLLIFLIIPIVINGQRIDFDSTFISNGQKFRVQRIQLEKYMTELKIQKGKGTILTDTLDFSVHLEIVDFNGDIGLDIIINFMGNVDKQSLFLLDKSRNEFKKIADFEKYPAAKKVKESKNLFYSYYRSGCADNYWTSDLFKIVDFKVVHLGQIFGEGCDAPMQVKIYKIKESKKDLIETLSYKVLTDNKDGKWGFIDAYWTKNRNAYE